MTENVKKKSFHYAWVILIVLCVVRSLAAAGINNVGGLFLSPVSNDIGVGVGTLSIYFSISSVFILLFMPIAAKLIEKFDIKPLMLIAIILQGSSMIALAFMSHVVAWYILAIPMGIGGAIMVNLCGPILINRWFKNRTGAALGILMSCVGIFGAIIQPIVINSINSNGWRHTYFILGAGIGIFIFILTLLFIKNSPKDKNTVPLEGDEKEKKSNNTIKATPIKSISLKQAFKSSAFWGLLLFMVALTAFGAFSQHMANYLTSLGYSAEQSGMVLSISMIGSTIGAILIGILSDIIGVFKTAICILFTAITSACLLAFGSSSIMLLAVGAFLLGLSSIGIPVLAPLLTKDFFGVDHYEQIYANVMMGPPLATVILLPAYGFIFDSFGSYFTVMCLILGIIIIGAISLIVGLKGKEKLQKSV